MKPDRGNTSQADRRGNTNDERLVGSGLQVRVPTRRRRSIPENLLTFAVIPSLLVWTMVIQVIGGDFDGAIQVAGATFAGFYVGWSLGETE